MTRESASVKGRRYLIEGRLIIALVTTAQIRAMCRGDGATYQLGWDRGGWYCDCASRTTGCAHLAALRLVTTRTMPDRR